MAQRHERALWGQMAAVNGLKEALGLGESIYLDIRATILKLSKEYISINQPFSPQIASWTIMENKLLEYYPAVYRGESRDRRLYVSKYIALRVHSMRRGVMMRSIRRRKARESEMKDLAIPVSNSLIPSPTTLKRKLVDLTLHDTEDNMAGVFEQAKKDSISTDYTNPGIQNSNVLPQAPRLVHFTMTERSHEELGPQLAKKESVSINRTNNSSRSKSILFIYNFLAECKPSMKHLLGRFLDNGCESEAKIKLLAEWSPPNRIAWLRNICGSRYEDLEGRPIKEMDIEILDNHIETYFIDGKAVN